MNVCSHSYIKTISITNIYSSFLLLLLLPVVQNLSSEKLEQILLSLNVLWFQSSLIKFQLFKCQHNKHINKSYYNDFLVPPYTTTWKESVVYKSRAAPLPDIQSGNSFFLRSVFGMGGGERLARSAWEITGYFLKSRSLE